MEHILYGKTKKGAEVDAFVMKNKAGLEVRCINYGARLTHVLLPGENGGKTDVLLGYDDLAGYEADEGCQGAFVGRYAGRIAGAGFDIGGQHHALTPNDGANFLHGSFPKRVFSADVLGENSVSFSATSPAGEDGFPGEVWASVIYTLTDQNELVMDYRAVSTAATHLNLTNHSYFNLAGAGTVLEQTLQLHAGLFLEIDAEKLSTGRMLEAAGAFDFASPKPIGRDIEAPDPQLKSGGGYDHCFVIDRLRPTMLAHAATAKDPASGRFLRVYTTQPGVQLYTANGLDGKTVGKRGAPLQKHGGFCLETQHFPGTPAFADFPPTLLERGEKYHQITVLQFGWEQ
ncbi:MAG: aldose epimerase family protein [Oscillospiraceae bacterium]